MQITLKENEKLLYSLRTLYEQYGYCSYRMSKFEKYELYAGNKDFLVSDRVITFSDTNGDLLALKPDVTLSIVRGVSFHPDWKQKLYYHENVYRPMGSDGRFHEMMQCGLECIGDLDSYDMYEVIRLAEKSLQTVSEESVLSFSHLGILKSMLHTLPAGEHEQSDVLRLIAARNEHELTQLFENCDWNISLLNNLKALLALNCSLQQLPDELRRMQIDWIDARVMQELDELSALASESDSEAQFDLSVINDIHYYNGIVFQGFVRGIAEKVLSGGRYDKLLERMNKKGSAVGFAVYLGLLEEHLAAVKSYDADVCLLYDRETPLTKLRSAMDRIQMEGKSVSAQRDAGDGRYRQILDVRGGGRHA